MDKKSKLLLTGLILIAVISIAVTFYRTVIKEDINIINTEEEKIIEGGENEVEEEFVE